MNNRSSHGVHDYIPKRERARAQEKAWEEHERDPNAPLDRDYEAGEEFPETD